MEERPRQLPQVRPGIAGIRQSGNFISVREKPDQDAGWGSLQRPKPLELPLLKPHRVRSHLGYEAVPATEVWQFTTAAAVTLQVNRISGDRYANSVAVALLNTYNQRVAPLVQSASGRGAAVEIKAGSYKVIAALGIAENVKFELEFNLTPSAGALRGQAAATAQAVATPLQRTPLAGWLRRRRLQLSAALLPAGGGLRPRPPALTLQPSQLLQHSLLQSQAAVTACAKALLSSQLKLAALQPAPLTATVSAAGQLAAVRWLRQPGEKWRARIAADGACEFNSAYVNFNLEPRALEQQREALVAELSPYP
jgi:hypothetical protein